MKQKLSIELLIKSRRRHFTLAVSKQLKYNYVNGIIAMKSVEPIISLLRSFSKLRARAKPNSGQERWLSFDVLLLRSFKLQRGRRNDTAFNCMASYRSETTLLLSILQVAYL